MKVIIILLIISMSSMFTFSMAQVRYPGRRHTYSHGGRYSGGHGSSHRGGHYRNHRTSNHYGRHRR